MQGGHATRQTAEFAEHTRGKAAGPDRDRPSRRLLLAVGPHPLQGRAPIQGDQAAVRLSENPAARPGQEPLQDQCAGSSDESVPGPAEVTRYSLIMGLVCREGTIHKSEKGRQGNKLRPMAVKSS